MNAALDQFPRVDPFQCTGCGKCWSCCPEGAIASSALAIDKVLRAAAERGADVGNSVEPYPPELHELYRRLKSALESSLACSGAKSLTGESARAAFDQLKLQGAFPETEGEPCQAELEAVVEGLTDLPGSATGNFFFEATERALLILAVNPANCRQCGVCEAVCPERAIAMEPQTPEVAAATNRRWRAFQRLPETERATIERAAERKEPGPLPASLMSRRCYHAITGGDECEPGSGERLAIRQVAAALAYETERRLGAYRGKVGSLADKLRSAIGRLMANAVTVENLGAIRITPKNLSERPAATESISPRLDDLGERVTLDVRQLERLIEAADNSKRLAKDLAQMCESEDYRHSHIIMSGTSLGRWIATFPGPPFSSALNLDVRDDGCKLAAEAMLENLARCTPKVQTVRACQQTLLHPEKAAADHALAWQELTAEELSLCPPVVFISGSDALSNDGVAQVNQLLSSGLPVKVVLLDTAATVAGPVERAAGSDADAVTLVHRRVFVASCSVAYPNHFFKAFRDALDFSGPALIQLYAPSPRQNGYRPSETIRRAICAVESRVRPLLHYDPTAEAEPGQGVCLEGNPALDQPWVTDARGHAFTPAHWAAGEERFSQQFRALAQGARPLPVEQWILLSPEEQSACTPTISDSKGALGAVGPELVQAVLEYAEIWARLQSLTDVGVRTGPVSQTDIDPRVKS
jgi:pyruvate-ferredoxin/flavodoxin oxidoreductase